MPGTIEELPHRSTHMPPSTATSSALP
uniref:Uncharacterized protein n=1 Tax=Arundo donax TaxID=35708 RepID=A0A0A9FA44_ARUDO